MHNSGLSELPPEYSRRNALGLALRASLATAGALILESCSRERQAPETQGEFSAEPTWEQDFSTMPDGHVDPSFWRYELDPEVPGYNEEAQGYTNNPRNVRIENKQLVIEAHREPYSYPNDPEHQAFDFTSGRIDTLGSLNFEFGKLEATMKLPAGSGTWPAFWLLSANQPFTNALKPSESDWDTERFYMHDGELDIVEAYGNKPGLVEATLHAFSKSHEGSQNIPDITEAFHAYGIEITPEEVRWTIDGKEFYAIKKPSDNSDEWPVGNGNTFYAILNLAMGGAGGKIDEGSNSWQMAVKNIKFYDLIN